MSDRQLLVVVLALASVNLYLSYRMADALQKLKSDADSAISGVKSGPAGGLLSAFGVF